MNHADAAETVAGVLNVGDFEAFGTTFEVKASENEVLLYVAATGEAGGQLVEFPPEVALVLARILQVAAHEAKHWGETTQGTQSHSHEQEVSPGSARAETADDADAVPALYLDIPRSEAVS